MTQQKQDLSFANSLLGKGLKSLDRFIASKIPAFPTSTPTPKPKPIQTSVKSIPYKGIVPGDLSSPLPGVSTVKLPPKLLTPTPMSLRKVPGDLASPVVVTKPKSTPTPTPTPITYNDMTPYEAKTIGTFRKYNIPLPVAYGIAAAEGGQRNRFNIGAVDSNPTLAPQWGDLETATKAAKLFSGQANPQFYGNGEAGRQKFLQAYNLRNNPVEMLKAIMDAGYAGNPKTWKNRSASTGGAGLNFNSWAEFVKNTPAYKKWVGRK